MAGSITDTDTDTDAYSDANLTCDCHSVAGSASAHGDCGVRRSSTREACAPQDTGRRGREGMRGGG